MLDKLLGFCALFHQLAIGLLFGTNTLYNYNSVPAVPVNPPPHPLPLSYSHGSPYCWPPNPLLTNFRSQLATVCKETHIARLAPFEKVAAAWETVAGGSSWPKIFKTSSVSMLLHFQSGSFVTLKKKKSCSTGNLLPPGRKAEWKMSCSRAFKDIFLLLSFYSLLLLLLLECAERFLWSPGGHRQSLKLRD